MGAYVLTMGLSELLAENQRLCDAEYGRVHPGGTAELRVPHRSNTCDAWRCQLMGHFERMRGEADPRPEELLRFWERFIDLADMERRRCEQRRATNVSDSDRMRLVLPEEPYGFVRRHFAVEHRCPSLL